MHAAGALRARAVRLARTFACAAVATACGGAAVAVAPPPERAERVSPVPVDAPLELPPPVPLDRAENGVVVLAAPPDPRPARAIVRAFFQAMVDESAERLERLLDRSARIRLTGKARAEPALPALRKRLERLDYTALGADILYLPADVEVHAPTRSTDSSPGPDRGLPFLPRPGEFLVRVPVTNPRALAYFGPDLVFLLRSDATPRAGRGERTERTERTEPGGGEGSGYKIAELVEDFRLP